jgi:hypothetical protein
MIRRSIVTLGSVLALVLTASAPTYAAPAPAPAIDAQAAADTRLTLDAKPEPIAKNRTITLTGILQYKSGTQWRLTPGSKVLTVQFDPSGSAVNRTVARVNAVDGRYTHKVTASTSGKWTVRYGGRAGALQASSAADAVCVYTTGRWRCPVSSTNPDLDCPDIGRTVWVGPNDYHRLDADNDGWGCDSYS